MVLEPEEPYYLTHIRVQVQYQLVHRLMPPERLLFNLHLMSLSMAGGLIWLFLVLPVAPPHQMRLVPEQSVYQAIVLLIAQQVY